MLEESRRRGLDEAAHTLARFLRPSATVVLRSTTYQGTTEELVGRLLEEGSGLMAGEDFRLGYRPERFDQPKRVGTVVNTPKAVSGVDGCSLGQCPD